MWLLIVIGANVPGASHVIALLFGTGLAADVVGALLAATMLISSLVIWIAAIAHLRSNKTIAGSRVTWSIVVYGLFVFGALIYYFTQMRRDDLAAA